MAKNSDSCLNCKHLNFTATKLGIKMPDNTCKAFPNGIPPDILFGTVDHHVPHKGDNGIQYEKRMFKKPKDIPPEGMHS